VRSFPYPVVGVASDQFGVGELADPRPSDRTITVNGGAAGPRSHAIQAASAQVRSKVSMQAPSLPKLTARVDFRHPLQQKPPGR
jgi:hypothetical protein